MADETRCKCIIGTRPDAAEINAALRGGAGLGAVAKPRKISRATLGKHRAKCLGIRGETSPPKTMADETTQGDGFETSSVVSAETPAGDTADVSRARIQKPRKPVHSSPRRHPPETPATAPAGSALEARPFPARPATREGRVAACMDLMSSFRWERGKTSPELATAWGMSVGGVEAVASEASRRLRNMVDPALVRQRICSFLEKGLTMALAQEDPKGLASVAKAYSEIAGAGASKRVELTGRDGVPLGMLPPGLRELSPPPTAEELEHFATTGEMPARGAPN